MIQAAQEKNARDLFDKTTHRQMQPRYVFETLPPAADPKAQRLELSERVRHEQLYAFVEIGPTALQRHAPADDARRQGQGSQARPGGDL